MKLYFHPHSRAVFTRMLLEEIGVSYDLEIIDITSNQKYANNYRIIHPHGQVPALEDEDIKLFESGAICLYLAARFPENHLFCNIEQHKLFEWIFYSVATIEPRIVQAKNQINSTQKVQKLNESFQYIERILKNKDYLEGHKISAADIMVSAQLSLAKIYNLLESNILLTYLQKIKDRPSFIKATS